ncbi:TauD/TfdA family dioxygenase [Streptomyces sp. NPDC026589]|uniref:TauD/TfdA family dioxygenase n=1 Tax=Streptomyces sp. NPDC026589 TaxID=3155609 RepID=UPI00340825F4
MSDETPLKPSGIRSLRPRKVTIGRPEPVRRTVIGGAGTTRLAVYESHADVAPAEWAEHHREQLTADVHEHGGVYFRGFGIDAPEALERFASVFVTDLFSENGEHPRVSGNGRIYTPVFHPPEERLLWHNENTFNLSGPTRIWFACVRPADQGGETPVADSRTVYERVPHAVREPFERKGVMYTRSYGTGLGVHWRDVFRTDSRSAVEDQCRAAGLSYTWRGETLHTSCVRSGVIAHPVTGQPTWFNQAQHWHPYCLGAEIRQAVTAVFDEDGMPRNCFYGDGSVIPDEDMAEILRVYDEAELALPWAAGDVMMLDNLLMAHGRNPFQGERRLLVAMGGMTTYPVAEVRP